MNLEDRTHDPLPIPGARLFVAALIFAGSLLSGCTSLRDVPLPSAAPQTAPTAVKVGDQVHVLTRSGKTLDFQVTAIESDALNGKDVRVLDRDIASLQVRRLSKGRTTTLVATVGGGAVTIAVIVWFVRMITLMAGP